MNKKLIVTGTVCAALLCTAAFAAPASETDSAPAAPAVTAPAVDPSVPLDAPTAMPEEAIPYSIGIKATVTEVLKSESGASIEVKPEDGETIVLNVSDKTILLDNQKAIPVSIEDIKAGDTIYPDQPRRRRNRQAAHAGADEHCRRQGVHAVRQRLDLGAHDRRDRIPALYDQDARPR